MEIKQIKFKKIYIEITNICNLNCPFCSVLKREHKNMKLNEFEKILKEIKGYTNYIYLHVKGEPLLHPNFKEILDLCYENNIKVNITTNGTLINKQKDIILNSLAIRQINISLHSFGYLDVDKQKQYLEDIMSLIKILEKEELFYLSLRFWLGNNPIQNYAINYIENALNVKIDHDKKQISKNVFTSFDEEFVWPENETSNSKFSFCHGIKNHLAILVDGTVVPCCLDGNGLINLGNIFKESLTEILLSPRYLKMYKAFETKKMDEELCKKCTFKNRFI